ncbi:MAG TPA: SCO family protein [Caulobacteraceae bacterium]|jgi:protein SCO1/2
MSAVRNRLILMAVGLALGPMLGLAACSKPSGGGAPVTSSGEALVGGPFQLVDQDGRPTDQTVLKGKWSAVFFGYTYCPDVCPTTLQALAGAEAKLGDKAKDLQVVFISVDPDRDTPAQMKTYLSTPAFPRGAIGLTGTPAQVAAAAKAYRVYYQKDGKGEGYSVAHSSIVYLMNPEGKFASALTESQTPSEVATQIGDAMAQGAKG